MTSASTTRISIAGHASRGRSRQCLAARDPRMSSVRLARWSRCALPAARRVRTPLRWTPPALARISTNRRPRSRPMAARCSSSAAIRLQPLPAAAFALRGRSMERRGVDRTSRRRHRSTKRIRRSAPMDGRLFFVSSREDPRPRDEADLDIWFVERDARVRWGKPERLPEPVNSPAAELLPRPQPDGSLRVRLGPRRRPGRQRHLRRAAERRRLARRERRARR